jgi:NAD(P)-dependent dehydrogenase (short-subunit alcohol dehydrogenase family)
VDYTKKTIVVTGAAKGIGAACAKLFYEAGANVVLLDLVTGTPPQDQGRWVFIQCNVAVETKVWRR